MKFLLIVFLFFIFLSGCLSPSGSDRVRQVELKRFQTLVTFQHQLLGRPGRVVFTDDGFFHTIDQNLGTILTFDKNGVWVRLFGTQGWEVGQYEINRSHLLTDGTHLIVQDVLQSKLVKFSKTGTFLREIPLEFPIFSTTRIAMHENLAAIPAAVEDRARIRLIDLEKPETPLAVFGTDPGLTGNLLNLPEIKSQLMDGVVPPILARETLPIFDRNGHLFLVYLTVPVIEKYRLDGEKLWRTELAFPEKNEILTHYKQQNRTVPETMFFPLAFFSDAVFHKGDLYVASVVPGKNPYSFIHQIDENGQIARRITFRENSHVPSHIAIHPERFGILFTDYERNTIMIVD